jgi:DNA-directed RNA polymerase subunit alpha
VLQLSAFKIEGASHEFTTVEGVKEDVVDIMLNLKQVRFKVYSDEPTNGSYRKENGKGPSHSS